MLPSTGHFKGISCPFYDSGLCERPYCHFRHVKKETQNAPSDGYESGAILQKLVSAAVQRVLQQAETSATTSSPQATPVSDIVGAVKLNTSTSFPKATYNPTPISELNKINNADAEVNLDVIERKRHIPVPYTPRKPTSLSIKRPVDTNGSSKPFIYIPPSVQYKPGGGETIELDPYTPQGSTESKETYIPGTESELQQYTINETQTSNKRNYVPSDRRHSKKKILEYKPENVTQKSKAASVTYQPTPRELAPCFSSDEEQPDTKKRKLSGDLNGLDDLGPEFDILDQILDEEKHEKVLNNNMETEDLVKTNTIEKKEVKKVDGKLISKEITKTESKEFRKIGEKEARKTESKDSRKDEIKESKKQHDSPKSKEKQHNKKDNSKHHDHDKTRTEKKHRSSSSDKSKHESKSKSSGSKNHKSSSKDKVKEERKDKTVEKNPHSRSKHTESSKKHSDNSSSKHSKHSSSAKHDSKKKHKSDHNSHKNSKENTHKKDSKHIVEKSTNSNYHSDNESFHNNDDIEQNNEELYSSETDEDTIALECKRIFEEYVPKEKKFIKSIDETESFSSKDTEQNEYIPTKKRISRTTDKNVKVTAKATIKPDYKVGAAQTMAERLMKVREYHVSRNAINSSSNESTTSKVDVPKNSNLGPSKIRIAHVPYASTLVNAKKTITPNPNMKREEPSTSSTIVQTIKKGVQRVAHIPNEKFIDRPGVLEPLASKIAANIRSTYLNMMIDECLKIYLSATDAYARAQHEELNTSKKCSTIQIYKNSAVLTVSRLRKELQECNGVKKSGSECSMLQRLPQTISGKSSNAGSWSIESKNRKIMDNAKEFSGANFYNNIKKWILTEQQLVENGFPRPHDSKGKGRAIIYGQNKQKPPKGYIRTCCRCKKDYTVDKKGFPAIKEECIYHPKNKYKFRGEAKYQCCSQDNTSDGCCIAPTHVYEYVDFENLSGFVRTMPPESVMSDYGVYSLDCEMCYTTHGLDLTRITVINSACKVVYETLIKPLHPIIDYNTRYSGITEEQMAEVSTTLLEVQATLLTMFSSETILIGHSLESDFKALKLIHDSVIDTSVLFPHKMGPPFKRALRNLSSEYLKKIIQESVDGHDSAEDATVCMELVIYKLREDLKTR